MAIGNRAGPDNFTRLNVIRDCKPLPENDVVYDGRRRRRFPEPPRRHRPKIDVRRQQRLERTSILVCNGLREAFANSVWPRISFLASRRLKIYTNLRPTEHHFSYERVIGAGSATASASGAAARRFLGFDGARSGQFLVRTYVRKKPQIPNNLRVCQEILKWLKR